MLDLLRSLRSVQRELTVLDATSALRPTPSPALAPDAWAPVCRAAGATHVALPMEPCPPPLTPLGNPAPYLVYDWLRSQNFDLVIAELEGGLAYFALAARRTGVACLGTTFVLLAENTTGLTLEQHGVLPHDPVLLERDYLEQCCAAWADGLWGGTAEQHAWRKARGWTLAPTLTAWGDLPAATAARAGQLESGPSPHITVALVHYERPVLLRQAVRSLVEQTYEAFDVVLVDDGSRTPEALACLAELEPEFAHRGWRIVRQENAYLGAARNHAVREARGEYVLFMDDDNVAHADELAVLARAAQRTGADVLTCCFDVFEGETTPTAATDILYRFVPLGASAPCGVFTNCFGDANALVRRSVFLAAGGFSEERNVGTQDYALFAKLILAGHRLEVVPQALFHYRSSAGGMRLATSNYRNQLLALRSYRAALPPALAPLLDFSAGAAARVLAESPALGALRAEREQWRAKAQSMEVSWSWRLTRGLRWLHERVAGRSPGAPGEQ